jgi:hypothetical protein
MQAADSRTAACLGASRNEMLRADGPNDRQKAKAPNQPAQQCGDRGNGDARFGDRILPDHCCFRASWQTLRSCSLSGVGRVGDRGNGVQHDDSDPAEQDKRFRAPPR